VDRFVRALWPAPPGRREEAWVASVLAADELLLFRRLPDHDRRHAIRVGRTVEARLGPGADPRWVQAALLHDVGKYDAGLSVVGRALATVAAAVARPARIAAWDGRAGWRGRVAAYAVHGETGEREILAVGGDPAVAAWSGAHHHPDTWADLPIPAPVVAVLDAADYRY
jgi:hypothetical protein